MLKRYLTVFIALSFSAASMQAQGAAWSLNYPEIFTTITTSQAPLEERELTEYFSLYANDQLRAGGVRIWSRDNKSKTQFDTFYDDALANDPVLKEIQDGKNATARDNLENFFGESLLMFKVLKNGRSEFYENQFAHWKNSWLGADFRWLKPGQTEAWSEMLIELFALALVQSGPMTPAETARIDGFFSAHKELSETGWKINIRMALARAKTWGNENPDLAWRSFYRVLSTAVIGAGTLYGSVIYMMNGGISHLPFQDMGPLGAVLFIIAGACASTYASIYAPVKYVPKMRWAYPGIRARTSYLFRKGAPTCETLLEQAPQ